MILYILITLKGIFGSATEFCPFGCRCNIRANGKINLRCNDLHLNIFTVTNLSFYDIDTIDLAKNQLYAFNGSQVSNFAPNIWMLDLNRNKFERIENETFKGFLNLKVLDLSYNNISKIDVSAFTQLESLIKLHLRGNKIRTVKCIWFRNMTSLELIDLGNNLIETFVQPPFLWPVNLKTLLLQSNQFHIIPPLPRSPEFVDLSENKIDCSCQQGDQENVDNNVLLNVHVTCNKMSTETWREQHWKNPICVFPTVHIEYKQIIDEVYFIKCTGDGFPPPKVTLKHGKVMAISQQESHVLYGLTNNTNVICEVRNSVGNHESTLRKIKNNDVVLVTKKASPTDQTVSQSKFSVISFVCYLILSFSCVLTFSALVVSLYIFNFSFQHLLLFSEA